jgi:excisionase family DNA binding protein
METEFLTKKELEKFLRISHGMVDKLMKTRQISFIKIGKKVLFRKADVEAWLETKRVK